MEAWVGETIQTLLDWLQLSGYLILLLTIPLSILQGIFSFFPFASLFVLHVTTFGLMEGLLISWILGSVAAIICFILCRYFFYDWFEKRLGKKRIKYDKWQKYMDVYGLWVIILLRTFPFVPNNMINFMASISPMQFNKYVWATFIGKFAHLWLVSLIGSTVFYPNQKTEWLWLPFGLFCLILFLCFLYQLRKTKVANRRKL